MSMVGCSHDPSAEKYKLYHFVFQITSIDCSVRKVTCHQLSHWPAGKLLPVTPQCAGTSGGAQEHCVYTVQLGGDTISTRCVFNRTGVMVSRDGERKQQERADCGSGLIPSQDDNHPTPAPPQPLRPHSFFPFASKLPGPHPVYASKPYAKEFNILYIFSGLQKKRCSLEGTREKNQIKKQLCIRKPEALK